MKRIYLLSYIAAGLVFIPSLVDFLQNRYLAQWSFLTLFFSFIFCIIGAVLQVRQDRIQAQHAAKVARVYFWVLANMLNRWDAINTLPQLVQRLGIAARTGSPLTAQSNGDADILRHLAQYDLVEITGAEGQLQAQVAPEYRDAIIEAFAGSP